MDYVSVVEEGFSIWNRHKILGLPYFLSTSLIVFLIVFCLGIFLTTYMWMDLFTKIAYGLSLLGGLAIVAVLVSSYFEAAAIAMADKALRGGKPDVHDALYPNLKHVWKVFAIRATTGSIILLSFLFLAFLRQLLLIDVITPANILAGCLLMYAPYYAVTTDKSWISSLGAGYKLFTENKLLTVVLWGFIYHVGYYIAYFVLPAVLLVGAPLPLIGAASGVTDATMKWFIILGGAMLAVVYVLASILASSLFLAPISTIWTLSIYKVKGGVG